MFEKKKIVVGDREVVIDPDLLVFNEITLSSYLESEGGWYDYYGQRLAESEYLMQKAEVAYDVIYSDKFKTNKETAGSDKLAEAQTKCDDKVAEAKLHLAAMKYGVRVLQQHLRAWDKSHDNAMSRGHFLRKEMDKLNCHIKADNYIEGLADAESQLKDMS